MFFGALDLCGDNIKILMKTLTTCQNDCLQLYFLYIFGIQYNMLNFEEEYFQTSNGSEGV